MSNRRKAAAPVPMRQPLLAALDVEYARATKAKDLARMEEITAIVETLKRLWDGPADLPEPVSLPEMVTEPVPVPDLGPVPEPEPAPLPSMPSSSFSLRDVLSRVADPWSNGERRTEAKERVRDTVLRATQVTLGDQVRYELALQAHNRNNRALEMLEPEANVLKIGVAELAAQIITGRRTAERRMQHAYTVLARVSAEIDQAAGDRIEELADAGIREIETMEG